MPDCTNVKQSCLRGWIDQDIQIAGFVIIPMKHRTKNTSIASVMALNHCAYGCTVGLQGSGWLHVDFFAKCRRSTREGGQSQACIVFIKRSV